MPRTILGLYDGHNTNAALVQDGRITVAVEEERFSRVKNHDGRTAELCAPRESVRVCLAQCPEPPDTLAVALEYPARLHREALNRYLASVRNGETTRLSCQDIKGVSIDAYDLMMLPLTSQSARLDKILRGLRELGMDTERTRVSYVNHHLAHAASVYYTSGLPDALVITLDGKGDNLSGLVARGSGSTLQTLHELDYTDSIGHFFGAVTVACGYQAVRHEGKVTGLAAYGQVAPKLYEEFGNLFGLRDGLICGRLNAGLPLGPYPHTLFGENIKIIRQLTAGYPLPNIAATAQKFLEDIVVKYVGFHLQAVGTAHLLVAGGVFANVRLNQHLASLPGVDSFSVHPAMSDAGLGAGAALLTYYQNHPYTPYKLDDVFLGPDCSENEIEQAIYDSGFLCERPEDIEGRVAGLLAAGEEVCRLVGRMEYGPRALGNRSILYRTNDIQVSRWLNDRLERTETMPFAPITLDEYMDRCYKVIRAARGCDEFMTITYDCTDYMRSVSPAVVHLDGTARPQRVCNANNPTLYRILTRYHELTGIPSLINTSFNIHEEPIVCSPRDAIKTFRLGRFRNLQMGNYLIRNPQPADKY